MYKWLLFTFASLTAALAATITRAADGVPVSARPPVGSPEKPRQVTSADIGPDINPKQLVAARYAAPPLFRTFRSFMSHSFAWADVWVYAANDDRKLYDTEVRYPYADFYRPTWGEVFDALARQMRCTWSWDPKNRQFRFERTEAEPFFGVKLADGWRREDRGEYVWHAPADQDFGLDIYYRGHYTPETPDSAADLYGF